MIADYIESYKNNQTDQKHQQNNDSKRYLRTLLNKLVKSKLGRITIDSSIWLNKRNEAPKRQQNRQLQRDNLIKRNINILNKNLYNELKISFLRKRSNNSLLLIQAFISWFLRYLIEINNTPKTAFINGILSDKNTQCIYIQHEENSAIFALVHHYNAKNTIVLKTIFSTSKNKINENEAIIEFQTTIEEFENGESLNLPLLC